MKVSIHYRYGGYWLADATDKEESTYGGMVEVSDEFWELYQRHNKEERLIQADISDLWHDRIVE